MPLSVRDLVIRYGAMTAVDGVSLDVHRGEIVGLLGPNGSGKSSTLAAAAGNLDADSGTVTIDGIARSQNPCRFAAKVGFVPQDAALYDELSASRNLEFFGQLYGLSGITLDSRVAYALDRARLLERSSDRVSTFSGGMKQRLNMAVALLHDPPLLLLDEPTASLDPASRDALFADLHRLRDDGHAILLTTHHHDEAEYGCDRVVLLNKGQLVASGTIQELTRTPRDGRAVLYGHLGELLPKYVERGLRQRLGPDVELEIIGHRVRLSACGSEQLGRALGLVLAEGMQLDTFRTPPGRLEAVARS